MPSRSPETRADKSADVPVPESLSGREALFRQIFEQSPIGKVVYDAAGRIAAANRAALAMFGVEDPGAVLKLRLFDEPNLPEADRARLAAGEAVHVRVDYDFGKIIASGYYATRKTGVINIDAVISPIVAGPGSEIAGYLAQVQDVTAVVEGSRKLEALVDLLPVGVSVLDRGAAVQVANPALQRILGLTADELRRGDYRRRRYLRADGSEMAPAEFPTATALREGRPVPDTEIGIVREDGSRLWTSVAAAPFPTGDWSVVTTVADITPRKEAERGLTQAMAELSRQRAFLTALFDANPSGMLVVDSGMRVRTANAAMARMLGVRPDEAAGAPLGELLRCVRSRGGAGCGADPSCDACQIRAAVAGALAGGQAFRHRTVLPLAGSGRPDRLVLLVSASAVVFEGEHLALVVLEDATELSALRSKVRRGDDFAGMISRDPAMREVFESIADVARADVPVLIEGESGTGKELVAAAVHRMSRRSEGPFVPVSCGSLPETLLESELFGHVKGAFTGAVRDKKGRFELAAGGTIFLDEIGELSPAMQVKLLRVLQEGTFERVGGERTLVTDARVISATNRDLRAEVAAGRFREDLFYRLAVVPITVPPLRVRTGDIPLLAREFLADYARDYGLPAPGISPRTMALLQAHRWPGNVRELQNALRYAVIKGKGPVIEPENLPPSVRAGGEAAPVRKTAFRRLTTVAVRAALRAAGGNRSRAARDLGVSRATLYRFLGETGE